MATPNTTTRVRYRYNPTRLGTLLAVVITDVAFNAPFSLRIKWDDNPCEDDEQWEGAVEVL